MFVRKIDVNPLQIFWKIWIFLWWGMLTYDPIQQNLYFLTLPPKPPGKTVLWRLSLDGNLEFWQLNRDYLTVDVDASENNPLVFLASDFYLTVLNLTTMNYDSSLSSDIVGDVGGLVVDTTNKIIVWAENLNATAYYSISYTSYNQSQDEISFTITCGIYVTQLL